MVSGVASAFRDNAESLGIDVLGFEGTDEKPPTLKASSSRFWRSNRMRFTWAASTISSASSPTSFAPQVIRVSFWARMVSTGPDFAKLAGDAAVGMYYTSAAGPASAFPDAAQFVADYTAKYNVAPDALLRQSPTTRPVLLLPVSCVRRQAANGEIPTRAAVAAEVRATKDYQGLTGSITFDANGDRAEANYFVLKVGSSDPAKWSNNEVINQIQIPSPLTQAAMDGMMTPEMTMGIEWSILRTQSACILKYVL